MEPITDRPIRLGVLISGGGTTLVNLLREIGANTLSAEIPIVIADRLCGGIDRTRAAKLHCEFIPRKTFDSTAAFSETVFRALRAAEVDLVVLAGFLSRIDIPEDFASRVMNIHPGLIPSFCGKGFYGHHVHEAVLEYGAKISGCTVHFVDNQYDHGPIILQRVVPVEEGDTPDTLAARVFQAECEAYPDALRLYAAGRLSIDGRVVHVAPAAS